MLSYDGASSAGHGHSASISSTHSSVRFGSVTTHSSAATTSTHSNARNHSGNRARHSLSVLGNLSNEISTLIRSHSSSRQQRISLTYVSNEDMDMLQDEERPTRKSKSESKIYRFITRSLTRSRSRSRSRNGRHSPPAPDPHEPVPDIPPTSTQNGQIRLDSMGQSAPSKPATRISSRPLSSTTTATNTTVTPGTPRQKKRPPSAIPILKTQNNDASSTPLSTVPKTSSTRKKLHNFFSIPLSSPRKPSFTSTGQSSSRPSLEVAPPPLEQTKDDDSTPKTLKSYPPNRKPSQNLGANTAVSASGSSRLQRFFSAQKATLNPTGSVSTPIRRPSGLHYRRYSNGNDASNHSTTIPHLETHPAKNKAANSGSPAVSLIPRKVYTTPLNVKRPGTAPKAAASSSLGHSSSQKNSIDSERGTGKCGVPGSTSEHARDKVGPMATRSSRSTKHGSFDFERPRWSANMMQRAVSGGTTGSGTSGTGASFTGWGRGQDGKLDDIRDSAMGPGMAGVGTIQREISLKRGKEREEMMNRAKEERRRRKAEAVKDKAFDGKEFGVLEKGRTSQPSPHETTSDGSRTTPVSTTKSSSWGKKQGLSSRGKGKLSALGSTHGLFDFEPAVPSPTWGTKSSTAGLASDGPASASWAGEKVVDKRGGMGGLERDLQRQKGKMKERRSQSTHRGDRAAIPVPIPAAGAGHRSGSKGRSLDLGLGLSWAPATMREDALLPTSGFFGRSTSGSSSLSGHSAAVEASRHWRSEAIEVIEESSAVGGQVAKIFKKALDDAGYQAFKRYVDQFDAHDIPFDGPTGIVARVERLLMSAPGLDNEGKRQLLDDFVRIVHQHT